MGNGQCGPEGSCSAESAGPAECTASRSDGGGRGVKQRQPLFVAYLGGIGTGYLRMLALVMVEF